MNTLKIALLSAVIAVVAAIVVVGLVGGNQPASNPDPGNPDLGGMFSRFPGDACQGSGSTFVCRGAQALRYVRGATLSSTTAAGGQASWQNTAGRDVFVRYSVIFDGVASSTIYHEVATSTAASVDGFNALLAPKVMPTIEVSTDTPAFAWSGWFSIGTTSQLESVTSAATPGEGTSTPAHKIQELFLGNRDVSHQLSSWGWVKVKHGEYVLGLWRSVYENCGVNGSSLLGNTNPQCENATSSNRGWDAYGTLEYMYVATSSR